MATLSGGPGTCAEANRRPTTDPPYTGIIDLENGSSVRTGLRGGLPDPDRKNLTRIMPA
jgi:hypothetical protein